MQTQRYIAQTSGASLIVLEDDQIRVFSLDARPEWTIGRYAPDVPNTPDILFTSRIVSREHGWIRNIDDQWFFVDNPKNLNGTFHNGVKQNVESVIVTTFFDIAISQHVTSAKYVVRSAIF